MRSSLLGLLSIVLGSFAAIHAGAAERIVVPPGLPLIEGPNAVQPEWVKQGLRLVYYHAACQVPGSAYYRDDKGDWVDSKTGQRYSESASGGSEGAAEINILAADEKAAILSLRGWVHANGTGPLIPENNGGYIVRPGESYWWINPAPLKELPNRIFDQLKIINGPYTVLKTGKLYPKCIVIRSETNSARIQHVYETDTGLLLHMDSMVRDGSGNIGVQRFDFVQSRNVDLPWNTAKPPEWFGKVKSMSYQGARTVAPPGIPVTQMPAVFQFAFLHKGDAWAYLDFNARTQLPGGLVDAKQLKLVAGGSQIGGLWIHPDVLGKLQAGQLLDKDDALGIRVDVSAVANQVAIITETGKLHSTSFAYDLRTGALSAQTIVNSAKHVRIDTRLMQMQ